MSPINSKIGGKRTEMGHFVVLSFMKILLVSPSLDSRIVLPPPQFYGSMAPMHISAQHLFHHFYLMYTIISRLFLSMKHFTFPLVKVDLFFSFIIDDYFPKRHECEQTLQKVTLSKLFS